MEYVILAIDITVACFAVLGFYGLVRWIAGKLFGAKELVCALEILTPRQAECADQTVRDTLTGYFSLPSGRLIVLTTAELAEHPSLVRAIRTYGLTCYVIKDTQDDTEQ